MLNQWFIHVNVPLGSQIKELKSRVADMEGQTRPSPGLALLENKIQELEERLRSEERCGWSYKSQQEIITLLIKTPQ